MKTHKFFRAAMIAAAVAMIPAAGAGAHQSGQGMMGQNMMGQGMMMDEEGTESGTGAMPPLRMMPGQMGYGMGPGMMGYGMMGHGMHPGMMGYGMGPGMMGYGMMGHGMHPGMMGHGMGYGMGSGMMGPGMMGYGMHRGMMGHPADRDLEADDVRTFLGRHLEMHGLKRLKVGDIDSSDEDVFKADIVTVEDSLVVRVVIDRHSGFPIAFE